MWEFSGTRRSEPWSAVDVPASASFHNVTNTANGPVAVGNTGTVIGRGADGAWGVLVPDGPSATGEALFAVATTDDGGRIWFVGANGALGSYEVRSGRRRDHSEPGGVTAALSDLAVAGPRGSEKLLVADDNGAVYTAEVSGSSLDWDRKYRPAGDTALSGLAAAPDGVGYAVDSNATAWKTTAEEGWAAVGIDAAENSFHAVAAGPNAVLVGGGNGRLFRSSHGEESWTPFSLGSFTVKTIDVTAERAIAAGTNGTLVTRVRDWRADGWGGSKTVNGAMLGSVDVAVCNDGVVLERPVGTGQAETGASSGSTGGA